MAQLEVNIDPQEEATFFQTQRPLWPFVLFVCTVPCCQTSRKFSSFRDFTDHWRQRHSEFISHYKCQACGKLFANNKHAKSHTTHWSMVTHRLRNERTGFVFWTHRFLGKMADIRPLSQVRNIFYICFIAVR